MSGRFDDDWWIRERIRACGGTISNQLNSKTHYLVVPDPTAGKGVRQKAATLNANGATIRILDATAFLKLLAPTEADVLATIRAGGKDAARTLRGLRGWDTKTISGTRNAPEYLFVGENFNRVDLTDFDLDGIEFDGCSFIGATLAETRFDRTRDCDFSRARASSARFKDATGSKFAGTLLKNATLDGSLERANFTNANLEGATISVYYVPGSAGRKKYTIKRPVFRGANLTKAKFWRQRLDDVDFTEANLTGCRFIDVEISTGVFGGAVMKDALLVACKLAGSDFRNADLRNANLADADLARARFKGANLSGTNLRGARLDGSDLESGKQPALAAGGKVGPSLKELDTMAKKAKRLEIFFQFEDEGKQQERGASPRENECGVHGSKRWGYNASVPYQLGVGIWRSLRGKQSFSDALMCLANAVGHRRVRFETLRVSTSKSSTPSREIRELALKGIQEAFAQSPPASDVLAASTKAHRQKVNKHVAAERRKYQAYRKAQVTRQATARAKAVAALAKAAGTVTDFDSFMKAIVVRIDKEKVSKATKMLKAEKFQLFNDVADTALSGVVKSQTDPDLVYACQIDHEGHYACCTQNLNICGGLRGAPCKHLLVLMIGLAKAGRLDPATIDEWVAKTHKVKPALDKEKMGEIFVKYKGAEAGEIDWRPTETLPEDYYSL